jgi:two-component system heavy metal sensor histidine kinase CusS
VLEVSPVDVGERLETIQSFFESSAAEAGVTLTSRSEPELSVEADPTLFQRAVSNIVANSLAHTPRGGRVSIEAAARGADLTITITDTGEGIPPEHQPLIFDRFFRSDQARTTDKDRVGLGLAITKKIVDLHGGTIRLDSRLGEGTRFSLTFPARQKS